MPYRNVYEEQKRMNSVLHRGDTGEEPEKDPKKIAEIYQAQLPTDEELKHKQDKLKREQRRIEKAKRANRGIRKSILD